MPYIEHAARTPLLNGAAPQNPGELNYVLTILVKSYIAHHGGRYQQINDAIGALECCKLELYRRLAAPYEDTKIKSNGDVY